MLNARQALIRDRLLKAGSLAVEELAAALGVSTMTVRRDLTRMEKAGVLTRTHGGCELQTRQAKERSFAEKDRDGRTEKMAIAAVAVRLLRPGQAIYLDTGTTALHLARALPSSAASCARAERGRCGWPRPRTRRATRSPPRSAARRRAPRASRS